MKISTFNSLGCHDLILQIGLPLPLVKQMLAARGIKEGNDFLVWENHGHRIEDYPDYLGTLIRASGGIPELKNLPHSSQTPLWMRTISTPKSTRTSRGFHDV